MLLGRHFICCCSCSCQTRRRRKRGERGPAAAPSLAPLGRVWRRLVPRPAPLGHVASLGGPWVGGPWGWGLLLLTTTTVLPPPIWCPCSSCSSSSHGRLQ